MPRRSSTADCPILIHLQAKVCTKCGTAKPLDAFNRDARARDGRRPNCAECAAANTRAARQARAERGQCQETGCPSDALPNSTRCAEHLAALRVENWSPARRAAKRARSAARTADGRAAADQRRARAARKAAGLCLMAPAHGPATNGVLCADCAARKASPYVKALRRATITAADAGAPEHDGHCDLCGFLPIDRLEADHILPVSQGGTDDPANLRYVCGGTDGCNQKRSNNLDWRPAETAADYMETDE
jgi:hypothetical protein